MNKELTAQTASRTIAYLAKAGIEAVYVETYAAGWINDTQDRPLVRFTHDDGYGIIGRACGPADEGYAARDIADVPALARLAKLAVACYGD